VSHSDTAPNPLRSRAFVPKSAGIVGLGSIGGSLALRLGSTVVKAVFDTDAGTATLARAKGFATTGSVKELASMVDLVVVATPMSFVRDVFSELSQVRRTKPLLVTDVSSVRVPVNEAAAGAGLLEPPISFVGGHPMAGSEHAGFRSASAGMLEGCAWVLAIDDRTDLDSWLAVAAFLSRSIGARVVPVAPSEHDQVMAWVSHLPHVLAAALAGGLTGSPSPGMLTSFAVPGAPGLPASLAAGSFRDVTRVAGSPPDRSSEMARWNAGFLSAAVHLLERELDAVRAYLASPEDLELVSFFEQGRKGRDQLTRPRAALERVSIPITSSQETLCRLLDLGRAGGWVTQVVLGGRPARIEGSRPRDRREQR